MQILGKWLSGSGWGDRGRGRSRSRRHERREDWNELWRGVDMTVRCEGQQDLRILLQWVYLYMPSLEDRKEEMQKRRSSPAQVGKGLDLSGPVPREVSLLRIC